MKAWARWAVLCGAMLWGCATAAAQEKRFEVASVRAVKGGGMTGLNKYQSEPPFSAKNVTLALLIQMAYDVAPAQMKGLPGWSDAQYDVEATTGMAEGTPYAELQPRLQTLLKERFHLAVHREKQVQAGYTLLVAKRGAKLKATTGEVRKFYILPNEVRAPAVGMSGLAMALARLVHRPVVDETGLSGTYDVLLEFAAENDAESTKPQLGTALEEQLGLRMEKKDIPMELLVIDHVDRQPTEN